MATPSASDVTVARLIASKRNELDRIFLEGRTPTMAEMVGLVDGRVGSVLLLPDFAILKRFINLGWFPWRGKRFDEVTPTEGKGINRFRIGPIKFLRYHCETFISPPLVGTNEVYRLNYDLPGNPGLIRRIRDDIKKVDEGVYLGSANIGWRGRHRFAAYFILRSAGKVA